MAHTLRKLFPFVVVKPRPAKAQITANAQQRAAHLANQFHLLHLRAPKLAVVLEHTATYLLAQTEIQLPTSAHYALLWAAPFLIGV